MKRLLAMIAMLGLIWGCNTSTKTPDAKTSDAKLPAFSLSPSEYPSWSTYIVAGQMGIINPKEGAPYSDLEKKYGVDVVLKGGEYEACLTYYANGVVDAVCITNGDVLNPALSRPSTAIMPTSSSIGADAILAEGDKKFADLKGVKVYALSKSVSEYLHRRAVEINKVDPKDYPFAHLDPGPAASAMQTGASEVKAICVWNPFQLNVLRANKKVKVVTSSEIIPYEIVDMVVVANESLKKPQGEEFATALCEIQYLVCKAMEDPAISDKVYAALGEAFFKLNREDTKLCCKQTRFFMNPQDACKFFEGGLMTDQKVPFPDLMKDTVIPTCQNIAILESVESTVNGVKVQKKVAPTIGFGDNTKQLNFDTKYMKRVKL